MAQTRRDFLKTGALGVSVSFFAPSFLARSVTAGTFPQSKVLVVLQMSGGNDCLNTFIPYTDPLYRSMRPNLGIADSSILKVDSKMGLHPSMTRLADLYTKGKFGFVNDVGFASLDRSHFRCRDVWQTGVDAYGVSETQSTGWLGRYGDLYLGATGSPMATVTVGNETAMGMSSVSVLPTTLSSEATFNIQTDPSSPSDKSIFISTVRAIYNNQVFSGDTEAIRSEGSDSFTSIDLLTTIPGPSTTAGYPDSNLGSAFQLAAQIIAGEVGTHVVWITEGGFDTHSTQADTHAGLLSDLSESLGAFYDDLVQRGLSDKVIVIGWSEFGRRLQENASLGTDHGKAGTVLLLGDGIKGGTYYGDVPNLSNLDSGDLETDIDFRSVYWTVIQDWFGNDPEPVLNATYENVGFIGGGESRRRAIVR